MTRVPDTVEEMLSPSWLSDALGQRYPGITVTHVEPGPVVARVSTNARFRIECEGGLPAGLPAELCGKGYFTQVGRLTRAVGEPEVCFYRDLAARTGVRTLRSVWAEFDPALPHGVVLTEDVAAQGAVFLDSTSAYTPELVAQSLEQLAKLHASTWNDPGLADVTWLAPRLSTWFAGRGAESIAANFDGPIGAGVPLEVRDPAKLVAAYTTMLARAGTAGSWTVVHGDTHIANVFLDAAGRPSFLDWQLVQRGPYYLDVGYHLASALTVEDRRGNERDLLLHYLDQLRAGGVDAPSFEKAWSELRWGILHGFYLWGITQKVDPSITTVLLERLGTAAADHGSLRDPG